MKTLPASLMLAGLLSPVVALAQTESPPRGKNPAESATKPGPQRPFLETWKAADVNRDEFISKEEFDAIPRIQNLPEEKRLHLFQRLDKDLDGKLSREEIARISRPHDGQKSSMQRLWELDVDKSGGISRDEFKTGQLFKKLPPERQDALFLRLDTDQDGVITPKDKPEPPFKRNATPHLPQIPAGKMPVRPRPEWAHLVRQFDQNGDRALSFDEFRVSPAIKDLPEPEQRARFSALDHNQDQQLSPLDLPPPSPRTEPLLPPMPPPAPAPAPSPEGK